MGLFGKITAPLVKGAISVINNVAPLRQFVSERSINGYADKTPPQPRSISMAADYTTWPGLVDRRFSGRHVNAGRIPGQRGGVKAGH